LAIFAARVLDIPLRLRALYLDLFLIDFPAIRSSPVCGSGHAIDGETIVHAAGPGQLSKL
jgi:hypothetical protein